jgi:hypothetical protein
MLRRRGLIVPNQSLSMASVKRISLVLFFICMISPPFQSYPQEVRVNQKKIEHERAKKHKKDVKQYNQAVKRHNKMQSKSTKASMKKTKRESAKMTPLSH